MKKFIKYIFALLFIAGINSGCQNFLTPSVDQEKPTNTAIQKASDLQATVYGALDELNSSTLYGRDFVVTGEVETDNAFSNGNSGRFITQDKVNYTANSGYASGLWNNFYNAISDVNLAINADIASSPEVNNIRGQAYGLRALIHMDLLLNFGQEYVSGTDASQGVPYVTTYNEGHLYPARDPIAAVWDSIGGDFDKAVSLMQASGTFDITTMNYWAVKGLQTRYYLYTKQYGKVISTAQDIISSGNFSITPAADYVSDWQSGSGPESLFEIAFTSTDRLGTDNIARIYRPTNYGDVEVTQDLYNAYDAGDVRLGLYAKPGDTYINDTGTAVPVEGYRMMGKYYDELGSDNVRVIRFAEVILNYAEALANSGDEPGALIQLTKITSNRNEAPYAAGTVANVLKERRLELAMEGNRLYDLARTGRDIPIGDSQSYRSEIIPFGDTRFALPIPDGEIRANSNISQNKGYAN